MSIDDYFLSTWGILFNPSRLILSLQKWTFFKNGSQSILLLKQLDEIDPGREKCLDILVSYIDWPISFWLKTSDINHGGEDTLYKVSFSLKPVLSWGSSCSSPLIPALLDSSEKTANSFSSTPPLVHFLKRPEVVVGQALVKEVADDEALEHYSLSRLQCKVFPHFSVKELLQMLESHFQVTVSKEKSIFCISRPQPMQFPFERGSSTTGDDHRYHWNIHPSIPAIQSQCHQNTLRQVQATHQLSQNTLRQVWTYKYRMTLFIERDVFL